jgi:sugar phosphate isomerase/epimerase
MAEAPELIAACWISAGNVMPTRTGDTSPIDLERRVHAVAAAGYQGMGLNHADLVAARDRIGLDGIGRLLADHGLKHVQLEFLDYWWETGDLREVSDHKRADLLDAARAFPVHHIKVGVGNEGDTYDLARVRDGFDALASDAAAAGTRVAIEDVSFSMMPDLAIAGQMVRDVSNPGGGLLLDIWHLYRTGFPYARMREVVPAGYAFAVELDDGRPVEVGTGLEDTFDNRELCGEGVFDVVSFIREVAALGYEGPWGVEHMSVHHRTLEPEVAALAPRLAALRVLREADVAGA